MIIREKIMKKSVYRTNPNETVLKRETEKCSKDSRANILTQKDETKKVKVM